MTASITPLHRLADGEGTYEVPLPTPDILDGVMASMELTKALMKIQPRDLRQQVHTVATPDEFREHLVTMDTAAGWLAGWSETIRFACDRLTNALTHEGNDHLG